MDLAVLKDKNPETLDFPGFFFCAISLCAKLTKTGKWLAVLVMTRYSKCVVEEMQAILHTLLRGSLQAPKRFVYYSKS